ncbi:aldose 1-epimerase [Sphingomonas daechungensis]|uniref:aldose 1-epimerase n=1 Tax=Sphingomonas daechungensis TaxID=1176646 RepID=UPI003784B075
MRESLTSLENVLEAGNFPLVPYVNRIRGGVFAFWGREIRLEPNMAGDPSPLHGQGWLNPWTADEVDRSSAVLSYRHEPGEWPWAYEAQQDFRLDDSVLDVGLTCTNTSGEPMPCGLGQHPYFQCGPQTRIDTGVGFVWTIDDKVLPVAKLPASGRYDLKDRLICGQDLDNGFTDWSGRALITDPIWPFEIELSSPEARFFQIYSPASGGVFVAEPVSHANAALNEPETDWLALGIRILEPGEQMCLDMRIDVRAI